MQIRQLRDGEELALYEIFHSAVHQIACRDYSPEQLAAWAPEAIDQSRWIQRIQGIQPFVVEIAGQLVAYADVQASGYIDHFYVAAAWARRGVGTALMKRIHEVARGNGVASLTSNVSLTAEPFFRQSGFSISERQTVIVGDVALRNARMTKTVSERNR